MHYSTRDMANLNELCGWHKLLLPIYDPGEHCIESLATGIAIGFQYVADEPACYVTTTPLTVEADGDPAIMFASDGYVWPRFGGTGRWDNTFIDHIPPAKWYRVEHGQLSHVSPCEVTL